MQFKLAFLLVLMTLAGSLGQNNCGAPQCYYPCTDSRPVVDIVFMIDVSGSLQNIINSVKSGLNKFIDSLNTNNINPAFAIVTFGNTNYPDGRLVFALSTNTGAFTSYMNTLSTNGAIEPGLEVLNQVMNNAAASNSWLNIAYRVTSNSQKVFILVTNEDSDMASYNGNYNANLFGVQSWRYFSNDGYCYNVQGNLPSGYTAISAGNWASWQSEINSVYNGIVSNKAFLYMFVAGHDSITSGNVAFSQTCNTVYQYCNPDLQVMNADYSGFNAASTLSNLQNNHSSSSLQGQLLAAGKLVRCFDVQDLNGPNGATLINNFFTQVVADLSACDTTCFTYTCITSTTCAPPTPKCDCNGVPFSQGGTATLDKNGVCCAAAQHDLNNVCCSGVLDPCKVCTPSGNPSPGCVQDCAGTYYLSTTTSAPDHTDECGNCVPASMTRSSTCVQDCAGNWYDSSRSSPQYVKDNCNYCVLATANPNAHKDYCGVCDGGNATMNQCGVCGGTKALDGCGNPVCKNIVCNTDCAGTTYTGSNPPHVNDACGNCVPASPGKAAYCVQDCAGVWFNNQTGVTPPHHVDQCGNCLPAGQSNPACVQDCNGVWGGTAYKDNCQQCVVGGVAPHPCVQDCMGNWYIQGVQTPLYTIDSCGVCNTAANQNIELDKCGVCTNAPGYQSSNCAPDCKGVWSLVNVNGAPNPNRAFTDACNDCWFANQTDMRNYYMDSCGVCWPSRTDPGWNSETSGTDNQGQPCHCTQVPKQCPNSNYTTCNDNCPVVCAGGVLADSCGRCPGQPYYNTGLDSCGVCATANHPPNADKDFCGICFGYNISLTQNPCHICDSSKCHVDCSGTPNGAKTYDVCGVCGGDNSTCDLCGDGVREGNEACDLGAQNGKKGSGCSSTCTVVTSNDAGAIAGGVIGGLVGLVALALAAFFALQYAKKNGLIGNANKQLDMTHSNSNPLYQGENQVKHNPLYGVS